MAKNTARMFAPIEKTEEQDDGTVKVWGYASAESVDSDGETITADAMKAALPDYLKFGAVRDMHKSDAVGTAIEAEVQEDGRTWFGAHVVDPVAVIKVRAKVFKGFSIGGRITERDATNKSTITGLKLVEVSLVDRPANPDAVFTMFKAESELSAIDEMAKMVNEGLITPARLLELAKADLTPQEIAAIVANSDAAAAIKAQEIAAVIAAEALLKVEVVDPPVVVEAVIDVADDLEKAGARNSKTDLHTVQSMHDGAVALGASCGADKAAAVDDLAKADTLAKAETDRDEALAKAATLEARIAVLEAAPVDGKVVLTTIAKGADIITPVETAPIKVIGYDGKSDDIATMIKSIHAAPIGRAL